jgi:TatD DNase family protein
MKYSSIDTHCHVQMAQYDKDREAVISRSLDHDIGMICVGVDLETSRSAIRLADQYEGLWCSVGLHPNDNLDEKYSSQEYELLAGHQKVIAIGEIGLDYYRTTEIQKKQTQRKRFEEQLLLVERTSKPAIIHCRDAHEDMLSIISSTSIRGVIHSFTGNLAQALIYREYGFYIGLNGIITFARQYDQVVKEVPLESMVIETDSPYLTPEPFRGQRNEPMYVDKVAQKISEIRGVSYDEVVHTLRQNTNHLFNV